MLKWKIQMLQREHFPIAFSRHRRKPEPWVQRKWNSYIGTTEWNTKKTWRNEDGILALTSSLPVQGLISRKSRKRFVPEKPFVKLWPAYSVTLALSYVVNGWKIKITVLFCASRCRRFEGTKGIMSTEMRPKSYQEKRELGICGFIITRVQRYNWYILVWFWFLWTIEAPGF